MGAGMRTGRIVAETSMARQSLDGGTVLSDDAGLPGEMRPLMWLVVDDAGYRDVLHLLVDVDDEKFGIMLAYQYAQTIMNLTVGTVAATLGDISDARVWSYPTSPSQATAETCLERVPDES